MKTIDHIIKCRFCEAELGRITARVSDDTDEASVTNETLGLADARCASCEEEHGSYKEMEQDFIQKTGETSDDFKREIADAGFSKSNLTDRVETIAAEKMAVHLQKEAEREALEAKEKAKGGKAAATDETVEGGAEALGE